MKRRMIAIFTVTVVMASLVLGWNLTARAAYETAPYTVVKKDGNYEVREYPDLLLAATDSKVSTKGRDGSFMRLFRYISGDNEAKQKISMTTPVFMEGGVDRSNALMGFVMPKSVTNDGAPKPTGDGVILHQRKGGRFAVIRFSGRMNDKLAEKNEQSLRKWMESNGLVGSSEADTAGYDPPFTPGPLRRNEILIRIETAQETPTPTTTEAGVSE